MLGTLSRSVPEQDRYRGSAAERWLVRREALLERLSGARGVVLVCAAAGSGKSILVRSWLRAEGMTNRTAWATVDRGERDARRFSLGIQTALASVDDPLTLVIDDLHELSSAEALRWLERFLMGVPPLDRVVLSTRIDPRLGPHGLHLPGEVTEIRSADLRFTVDETRELLMRSGINLTPASVAGLHERTEGWVAGLRLAAISLVNHPDPERFVSEFSGSEHTVADYLIAEVLERQPPAVRDFLLRTSVLERVSGPLADYLTGGSESQQILRDLEDANAFVCALDPDRTRFRYHHLFRELLKLELRRRDPTKVGALHLAAAEWCEDNGCPADAIQHALHARDWTRASRVLAQHYVDLILSGHIAMVRRLLRGFPEDLAAGDPELALVAATVSVVDGEPDASATAVELAQRFSHVVPAERRRDFDVALALARLVEARCRGDLATALSVAPEARATLAAQPLRTRALTAALTAVALESVGVAQLWSCRLEDARRDLQQASAIARSAERPWLEGACLGHLGLTALWSGSPIVESLRLSREGMSMLDAHGWSEEPLVLSALLTEAMAALWQGRFADAEAQLKRAQCVLHPDRDPGSELVVHHIRGVLRLAQHRCTEALDAFQQAERMQAMLVGAHTLRVDLRSRALQVWIRTGDVDTARAVLDAMSARDRHQAETRIASATLALSDGAVDRAEEILAPVIDRSVVSRHSRCTRTEALLLAAAIHDRHGDESRARASLRQAFDLAQPEDVILPFAIAPVRPLFELGYDEDSPHVGLRTAVRDLHGASAARCAAPRSAGPAGLSEAEARIVSFLPSNLTVPEIASELFVSNNTVRTHLRHIYAKLDAHTRAGAVERARERGLLAPFRAGANHPDHVRTAHPNWSDDFTTDRFRPTRAS